jgi:hypothetical protein
VLTWTHVFASSNLRHYLACVLKTDMIWRFSLPKGASLTLAGLAWLALWCFSCTLCDFRDSRWRQALACGNGTTPGMFVFVFLSHISSTLEYSSRMRMRHDAPHGTQGFEINCIPGASSCPLVPYSLLASNSPPDSPCGRRF